MKWLENILESWLLTIGLKTLNFTCRLLLGQDGPEKQFTKNRISNESNGWL